MEKIKYDLEKQTLFVTLSGRMDTMESMNLEPIMEKKVDQALKSTLHKDDLIIQMDLQKVEYVSSTFLRVCLASAKKIKHGNFRVININEFVKQTFQISGFDEMLHVV